MKRDEVRSTPRDNRRKRLNIKTISEALAQSAFDSLPKFIRSIEEKIFNNKSRLKKKRSKRAH